MGLQVAAAGKIINEFTGLAFAGGEFETDNPAIRFVSAEAWTRDAQGAHITFATAPVGTSSPVEGMRLTSEGILLVGTDTASGSAKLQVSGAISVSGITYAGTLALSATGANVITLSTNGSERARFASDGTFQLTSNTGKYIALASTRVNSTNRNWDISLDNSDEGSLDIRKSSAKDLFDYSPVVSFTRDGNVMIGTTTNSGARLNVQAGNLDPSSLTGQITYTSAANKVLGLGASANDAFIQSFNGPLVLNSVTRNVLVGTTTDDDVSKLQVNGIIRTTQGTTSEDKLVVFDGGGGNRYGLGIDTTDLVIFASTNAGVTFRKDSNSGTSLARLASTGTFTLYNQTATTGSTSLVVRAGAGQSTNAVLNVTANDGTTSVLKVLETKIGFFNATPVVKQTVTADAASILAALQAYGLAV